MKAKLIETMNLGPGMGYSHKYLMGECQVIVSGQVEREFNGWHFSISHPTRYPTWEEQKAARYELIPDEIYMVSIMPPKSEYVNVHPNCFHWHELGMKLFNPLTGKPIH